MEDFSYDAVTIAELREDNKIIDYIRSEFKAYDVEAITPLSENERRIRFHQIMTLVAGKQAG